MTSIPTDPSTFTSTSTIIVNQAQHNLLHTPDTIKDVENVYIIIENDTKHVLQGASTTFETAFDYIETVLLSDGNHSQHTYSVCTIPQDTIALFQIQNNAENGNNNTTHVAHDDELQRMLNRVVWEYFAHLVETQGVHLVKTWEREHSATHGCIRCFTNRKERDDNQDHDYESESEDGSADMEQDETDQYSDDIYNTEDTDTNNTDTDMDSDEYAQDIGYEI